MDTSFPCAGFRNFGDLSSRSMLCSPRTQLWHIQREVHVFLGTSWARFLGTHRKFSLHWISCISLVVPRASLQRSCWETCAYRSTTHGHDADLWIHSRMQSLQKVCRHPPFWFETILLGCWITSWHMPQRKLFSSRNFSSKNRDNSILHK